jgi:hypothetical protein
VNEIAFRLATRVFDQPRIMNTYRGAFIEAMLEPHLAQAGWDYHSDYGGWDFEHAGGAKLEVKQAAWLQTWDDELRPPPAKRRISFDIAARTGWWDAASKWIPNAGRHAHLYVFGYHGQITECDQRRPDQWEFFTVPTAELDGKLPTQKKVSLKWLRAGYRSVVGPERCADKVAAWLQNAVTGCRSS